MPPKKRTKQGKPKESVLHDEAGTLSLPTGVVAVCSRSHEQHRSRMFVPGVDNTFAGIAFPHVMIDSGCNSLLLPFPQDISALKALCLDSLDFERYRRNQLTDSHNQIKITAICWRDETKPDVDLGPSAPPSFSRHKGSRSALVGYG